MSPTAWATLPTTSAKRSGSVLATSMAISSRVGSSLYRSRVLATHLATLLVDPGERVGPVGGELDDVRADSARDRHPTTEHTCGRVADVGAAQLGQRGFLRLPQLVIAERGEMEPLVDHRGAAVSSFA